MSGPATHRALASFDALKQFARRARPTERCELCGAELADQHRHLWETAARRMVCSCDACGILFEGAAERKFRAIVPRVEYLADFRLSDAQWELLGVPIDLAFFSKSADEQAVAVYPGPAGATESLLASSAWAELAAENPVLEQMTPEVEGLLVHRARGAREYYRVSIDECYRLTGLIRTHWSGLSGGTRAWQEIAAFFAGLRERSARRSHA